MCLAAVYKAQDPETKLFEFVSRIDVDGETITLTDVMGEQKVLEGTIVIGAVAGNGRPCKQHCEDQLHGILAVIK